MKGGVCRQAACEIEPQQDATPREIGRPTQRPTRQILLRSQIELRCQLQERRIRLGRENNGLGRDDIWQRGQTDAQPTPAQSGSHIASSLNGT